MRLLRVHNLQFVEYTDERQVPHYGILSHRWRDQEESYHDMISGRAETRNGYAYRKIRDFCKQCALQGLSLAWVDTCCIDKTSSAELSEAINSMYRWYQNSAVCMVYLGDVETSSDSSTFMTSSWFERGWTLQELIAPEAVSFYNCHWQHIGTKQSLSEKISAVCKIPENVLHGEDPRNYSIAQRMSWAAKRTTTRIEDEAYSLLGLFDVNMPMLYGEGHRAFIRLQEEIIRRSSDHSIFAWPGFMSDYDKSEMYDVTFRQLEGLLATTVAAFALCGNIIEVKNTPTRQSISVTNLGLSLSLPLRQRDLDKYEARLSCCSDTDPSQNHVSIYLRQMSEDGQFARDTFKNSMVSSWSSNETSGRAAQGDDKQINVIQGQSLSDQPWSTTIVITASSEARTGFSTGCQWNQKAACILDEPDIASGKPVVQLSAQVGPDNSYSLTISLSFDFDFNPLLLVRLNRGAPGRWINPYPLSMNKVDIVSNPFLHRLTSCSYAETDSDAESESESDPEFHVIKKAQALYQRDRRWAFSGNRREGILACVRPFNLAINVQRKAFVRANVWTIDMQKADTLEPHFLGQEGDGPRLAGLPSSFDWSSPHFWLPTESAILAKDKCCVCHALMIIPLVTTCAHSFCQVCTCWIDSNFTSVSLQKGIELNSQTSLHEFQWGKHVLCPLCGATVHAAVDWERQEEIHKRYPNTFRFSYWNGQSQPEDAFPAFETITLTIGNTHKLTQIKHAGLDRANRHDWTFFVRPSLPNFVAQINITLHPSFKNNEIKLSKQPFEVRRFGWGTFQIRARVILKPGYAFLHDATVHVNGGNSALDLFWVLSFDGDGSQGRLKVVVQRSKRTWSENDKRLQQQIQTLWSRQQAASEAQ